MFLLKFKKINLFYPDPYEIRSPLVKLDKATYKCWYASEQKSSLDCSENVFNPSLGGRIIWDLELDIARTKDTTQP
jgi:hypothetical protein